MFSFAHQVFFGKVTPLLVPSLCWCSGLLWTSEGQDLHLPGLNFMWFLSAHSTSLLRSTQMAALPAGVPTTTSNLALSSKILRLQSIPLSRSWLSALGDPAKKHTERVIRKGKWRPTGSKSHGCPGSLMLRSNGREVTSSQRKQECRLPVLRFKKQTSDEDFTGMKIVEQWLGQGLWCSWEVGTSEEYCIKREKDTGRFSCIFLAKDISSC